MTGDSFLMLIFKELKFSLIFGGIFWSFFLQTYLNVGRLPFFIKYVHKEKNRPSTIQLALVVEHTWLIHQSKSSCVG